MSLECTQVFHIYPLFYLLLNNLNRLLMDVIRTLSENGSELDSIDNYGDKVM